VSDLQGKTGRSFFVSAKTLPRFGVLKLIRFILNERKGGVQRDPPEIDFLSVSSTVAEVMNIKH
jgi:hypothetical protein